MNRHIKGLPIATLALLLSGCGGGEPAADKASAQGAPTSGTAPRTASAPGAAVFIISPVNGATVGSPVAVKFGISGMTVAAAGRFDTDSGHHHLLIDAEPGDPGQPIPSDAGHLHFGKGQTETTVELEPGRHTLQLVLGDGNHVPHEPPVMSDIVTITVE